MSRPRSIPRRRTTTSTPLPAGWVDWVDFPVPSPGRYANQAEHLQAFQTWVLERRAWCTEHGVTPSQLQDEYRRRVQDATQPPAS